MDFALIGKPVSHSFSPKYFRDKFVSLGLQYTYDPIELSNIKEVLTLLDHKDLKGFNVTSPYKQAIIPYLDDLSREAQVIEAVNVVKITNSKGGIRKLKGYNTDCLALIDILSQYRENILILGSGGAAQALLWAAQQLNLDYLIISRTKRNKSIFNKYITYNDISSDILRQYKMVVNATPIGLHLNEIVDIPYHFLNTDNICFDMIYNPPKTLFLQFAERYGCHTINGLDMLRRQAEYSWNIWINDND